MEVKNNNRGVFLLQRGLQTRDQIALLVLFDAQLIRICVAEGRTGSHRPYSVHVGVYEPFFSLQRRPVADEPHEPAVHPWTVTMQALDNSSERVDSRGLVAVQTGNYDEYRAGSCVTVLADQPLVVRGS